MIFEQTMAGDIIWVMLCSVFVALMQAGFLCMETGLCRSKNSINIAVKNLSDLAIAIVTFPIIGIALMYGPSFGGFLGVGALTEDAGDLPSQVFLTFQLLFCATAATIMSGAVVERMRFSAYLLAATLMTVLIYPVFGHWVWADGGWLKQLGAYDFAGSTVVHSIGGWAALALAVVLGPRIGRFSLAFGQRAQSVPMATLGAIILWVGWLGFNGGSTLAFTTSVPVIIDNTLLGGGVGTVTILAISLLSPGMRADPLLILNGGIAGLVAVTASANLLTPPLAMVIGSAAALACFATTRWMEQRQIDDGIGVVAAHLSPGILGSLAVPFAATPDMLEAAGGYAVLFAAQTAMVIAAGIWGFGTMFVAVRLIDRFQPIRVSEEDEIRGLDQAEHGMVSELTMASRELKARLSRTLLHEEALVDANSEVGQVIQILSEAAKGFRVKQRKWLSQIAQLEASNGLLRTRTEDLEQTLATVSGDLSRTMDQLHTKAAEFQEQIEAVECQENARKRILDYVTKTAAACARLIDEEARSITGETAVDDIRRSIEKVKGVAELLASDLDSFIQLCLVANDDNPLPVSTMTINDVVSNTLRDMGRKRKTRLMSQLTFNLAAKLPKVTTNRGVFEDLIRHLMEEALLRSKPRDIKVGTMINSDGLHVVIKDEGPAMSWDEIEKLKDPLASMATGHMSSGRISCRLGSANLLAQRLGTMLTVTASGGQGLTYLVSFPKSQLHLAKPDSPQEPEAVAAE